MQYTKLEIKKTKVMRIQIQEIIEKIPKGKVFDAHSVIEYLIQNDSDIYLSSYNSGETTAQYHSRISRTISSFQKENLIKPIGESWSQNIRDNFSENKCWEKL